jgi:hypothetical protein
MTRCPQRSLLASVAFCLTVLGAFRASAQDGVKPCSPDKALGGRIEITSEWNEGGCRGSIKAVLRFPLVPRTPASIGNAAVPWSALLVGGFSATEIDYELTTDGCSGGRGIQTCNAPSGRKAGEIVIGKVGPLGFELDRNGKGGQIGSVDFHPMKPELFVSAVGDASASTPMKCFGTSAPGFSLSTAAPWLFDFRGMSIGPSRSSKSEIEIARALDVRNVFVVPSPPGDCSSPTGEAAKRECAINADRHAVLPFSGDYSWTSPEPPEHSGLLSYKVHWDICCGCDEKPGAQVHLVEPEPQTEFTFDINNPGMLEIKFKAEVTPANAESLKKMQDKVLFKMGTIGNSKMEWDAANPGGKPTVEGNFLTAKLKFTGLPAKNDDFGEKKIELLVDGTTMETVPVKIFFPKLALNHPGGKSTDPNWFYYWQEGKVCGIAATDIYDGSDSGWGYSKPAIDSIVRLCPLAPMANSGPEVYQSGTSFGSLTVTGVGKGIKCVAETLEHERHHILIYQSFHQTIAGDATLDPDRDEITAQGEGTLDGIRSDPANGDTFNMGGGYSSYGDNEVRCREVERKLTVQYFPEKDWANPGCQTHPAYGP